MGSTFLMTDLRGADLCSVDDLYEDELVNAICDDSAKFPKGYLDEENPGEEEG